MAFKLPVKGLYYESDQSDVNLARAIICRSTSIRQFEKCEFFEDLIGEQAALARQRPTVLIFVSPNRTFSISSSRSTVARDAEDATENFRRKAFSSKGQKGGGD